jgi:tRNA(fMet)-specific endonuclease VapC
VKYVLDTNVVSSLMRGDPRVIARLKRVARRDVYMPQPVLAEIAYGIQRLARSRKRDALESRFELLKAEIQRAVWSDDVSARFGVIKSALERKGERIEDFDAAVAAHAVAVDSILVTADSRHMPRVPGIAIEDWSDDITTSTR